MAKLVSVVGVPHRPSLPREVADAPGQLEAEAFLKEARQHLEASAPDVIIEIAGQTIANIYDYTYALDLLKIGQPAKVIYMRDGKRQETMLTPAARK